MRFPRAGGKTVVGVILVVIGLLLALNGLISGPCAFWGGISGVVGLGFAGLILAGAGGKLICDGTHNGKSLHATAATPGS
jgi:hypothetical protein